MEHTCVVTFAGMGGSTTGLVRAGYKELYALDFVKHCVDIIKANYPDIPNVVEGDMNEVTGEDVLKAIGLKPGELFLYQTSPSCRAFSRANSSEDKATDEKNELYKRSFEHVAVLKPKVVVLENVLGMVDHPYAVQMIYDLTKLGYQVRDFEYWSGELGSAQMRPRIFLVGYRNDLGKVPSPISEKYYVDKPLTISDVCPDVEYLYMKNYGDIKIRKNSTHMMTITSTPSFLFCKKVDATEKQLLKNPTNLAQLQKKKQLSRLFHDPKIFDNFNEFNDTVFVKPTVEELLRLSDFPEDYDMCADRIKQHTKCWNRIGDVVVPKMMEALGKHIIDEVG